jgi:hypothetical protein
MVPGLMQVRLVPLHRQNTGSEVQSVHAAPLRPQAQSHVPP